MTMKTTASVLCSLAIAICLGGCQNPGIVQISPDTYMLSRDDHAGIFGNKNALKAGVIRDANAFAESRGKIAIPISAKEHPVGVMGDWASFEYQFRPQQREPDQRNHDEPQCLQRRDLRAAAAPPPVQPA